MKKVFTVAAFEFRQTTKRWQFIAITFLLPIFFLFLGFISYSSQAFGKNQMEKRLKNGELIYVEDRTGHFLSSPDPNFHYVPSLESTLSTKSGKFLAGVIIPTDYLTTGKIKLVIPESSSASARMTFRDTIQSFLRANLLKEVSNPLYQKRIFNTLSIQLWVYPKSGFMHPYDYHKLVVPSLFTILFILFQSTASSFLLQSISEEKENRTIEILLSSVRDTQLIAGKVLGLGSAAMVQIISWSLMATFSFSAIGQYLDIHLNLFQIPISHIIFGSISFLLGFFLFAALMIGVGSLAANYKDAQQLSSFFIITSLLPIYVLQMILEDLHGPLASFLNYFPLTAPLVMTTRYCVGQLSLMESISSIICLFSFVLFFLWFGSRCFRLGSLMYNRRPSWREVRVCLGRL